MKIASSVILGARNYYYKFIKNYCIHPARRWRNRFTTDGAHGKTSFASAHHVFSNFLLHQFCWNEKTFRRITLCVCVCVCIHKVERIIFYVYNIILVRQQYIIIIIIIIIFVYLWLYDIIVYRCAGCLISKVRRPRCPSAHRTIIYVVLYYIIYTNCIIKWLWTLNIYYFFGPGSSRFSKCDFYNLVLILISVFQSVDKKVIHGLVYVNKITMILYNYLSNLTYHIFHIIIARDQLVSLYIFIFFPPTRVHMYMKLKNKNDVFK